MVSLVQALNAVLAGVIIPVEVVLQPNTPPVQLNCSLTSIGDITSDLGEREELSQNYGLNVVDINGGCGVDALILLPFVNMDLDLDLTLLSEDFLRPIIPSNVSVVVDFLDVFEVSPDDISIEDTLEEIVSDILLDLLGEIVQDNVLLDIAGERAPAFSLAQAAGFGEDQVLPLPTGFDNLDIEAVTALGPVILEGVTALPLIDEVVATVQPLLGLLDGGELDIAEALNVLLPAFNRIFQLLTGDPEFEVGAIDIGTAVAPLLGALTGDDEIASEDIAEVLFNLLTLEAFTVFYPDFLQDLAVTLLELGSDAFVAQAANVIDTLLELLGVELGGLLPRGDEAIVNLHRNLQEADDEAMFAILNQILGFLPTDLVAGFLEDVPFLAFFLRYAEDGDSLLDTINRIGATAFGQVLADAQTDGQLEILLIFSPLLEALPAAPETMGDAVELLITMLVTIITDVLSEVNLQFSFDVIIPEIYLNVVVFIKGITSALGFTDFEELFDAILLTQSLGPVGVLLSINLQDLLTVGLSNIGYTVDFALGDFVPSVGQSSIGLPAIVVDLNYDIGVFGLVTGLVDPFTLALTGKFDLDKQEPIIIGHNLDQIVDFDFGNGFTLPLAIDVLVDFATCAAGSFGFAYAATSTVATITAEATGNGIFEGVIEDALEFIAAAYLPALPSIIENLSFTLPEAVFQAPFSDGAAGSCVQVVGENPIPPLEPEVTESPSDGDDEDDDEEDEELLGIGVLPLAAAAVIAVLLLAIISVVILSGGSGAKTKKVVAVPAEADEAKIAAEA